MPTKTYRTTIHRDGSMCFIPVPFDPRAVFGKVRAPVKVTHQREYAEALDGAKAAETRRRRIENAVRAIGARPARALTGRVTPGTESLQSRSQSCHR
jgi:hypothetical protein